MSRADYTRRSWSGPGFDRWVERNSSPVHNSTLGKMQRQFWFTKSAVMRKLGKKQDEHIVASDAELDAKMELFKAIQSTTRELQAVLAEYQNKVCLLAQEENSMGRLLKDWGRNDRGTASQVMTATGKSLSYTAQQRLALRGPLVRLFQEVDTFHSRAIEDTGRTLAQMEKMRTEYRGALMWMKNISQDFNPDQYSQLEKFRQVQEIVRQKKAKFDVLKVKSIQKIDLLAASRCNMFSHALILYQNSVIQFSEKTAKTLNTVANNFNVHPQYSFQVIKELAEPEALKALNQEQNDVSKEHSDDKLLTDDERAEKTFFGSDYHDEEMNDRLQNMCPRHNREGAVFTGSLPVASKLTDRNSDSLLNLYDASESEKKDHSAPSYYDLLCKEKTEYDAQQMLKDLFDSPIHQPQAMDKHPSSSSPSQISTQGQFFMPSQLLDFGFSSCNTNTEPETHPCGSASDNSSAPLDLLSPVDNVSAPPCLAASHSSPVQDEASIKQATTANTKPSYDTKLDWFKVFQDIDPLADPSSLFFNKKPDLGGSC